MPRAAPHSHPSTPASHGPGRSARRPVLALPVSWQPAQALPSGRDPRARRAGALLEHSVTRLQRASVPGTCCGESQRLGRCPVGFRRSTVRGGRTRLAGLGGAVPQVPKVQKSRPRPAWAPRAAEAGRGSKPTGPALCSRFSLPRSRHRRAPLPLAGFTARKRRGGSRPGDLLGFWSQGPPGALVPGTTWGSRTAGPWVPTSGVCASHSGTVATVAARVWGVRGKEARGGGHRARTALTTLHPAFLILIVRQ